MSKYMLLETRDALTGSEVVGKVNMAADLQKKGYKVTLFLSHKRVPQDSESAFRERLLQVANVGVHIILTNNITPLNEASRQATQPCQPETTSLNFLLDHLTDSDIALHL